MEQLLSQDEIDALLNTISSQDDEPEIAESETIAATPQKARVFDFTKYTKGRKERLPALEFITDRLSKS